jgi:hypothetical protein
MLLTNSSNAQQAHDRFDAFMVMMGLNKTAADKLWGSVDHVARSLDSARRSALNASGTIGGALLRALQEVSKAWRLSLTETGSGHFSITGPGGQSVAGPGGRFGSGKPLAGGGYIGWGSGPVSDDVPLWGSKIPEFHDCYDGSRYDGSHEGSKGCSNGCSSEGCKRACRARRRST